MQVSALPKWAGSPDILGLPHLDAAAHGWPLEHAERVKIIGLSHALNSANRRVRELEERVRELEAKNA